MTFLSRERWTGVPEQGDARPVVAALLFGFLVFGVLFLGFDRSPAQYIVMAGGACLLDMALHYALRDHKKLLFPLSAFITGTGLSILTHFAATPLLGIVPVYLAIASKYLLTVDGRHVWNPGLFGIVCCLLLSGGMVAAAPVYQWGDLAAMIAFICVSALSLFVFNINRATLTVSFLALYFAQLLVRAALFQDYLPLETLLSGTIKSPAFYMFVFFMITDPKTSPENARGQFGMAAAIVGFDFALNLLEIRFSYFYAGFLYFLCRFVYLKAMQENRFAGFGGRMADLFVTAAMALPLHFLLAPTAPGNAAPLPFTLTEVAETGITGAPSALLSEVDPRAAHVAKWFYMLGDAAAVADVDRDGLPDVFLTQPLKAPQDRAQLYLNRGGFSFEKFPVPALDDMRREPAKHGSPTDALFFDKDNDGDLDLLVTTFWGGPLLLENLLSDTGALSFRDVTGATGLVSPRNSATANAADFNGDGRLDLVIGGTLPETLPDYDPPRAFNLFRLPEAEYEGDRRMLNFMRRKPFDSTNASTNRLYINTGDGFAIQDNAAWGLDDERRWTLDIAAGDIDGDGLADLFFANSAGPDRLYLNTGRNRFATVRGLTRDRIGRDTYRGMNASIADFDGNSHADIYVSNMHKPVLPEGGLLWMNDGRLGVAAASALSQEAFARGILNRNRFGWGAAVVDLDMDGDIDIAQANGWLDDRYDKIYEECPNYEYRLFNIELTPPDTHGYADNWPDLRGRCLYDAEPKRVFINAGDGRFIDRTVKAGWMAQDNARGVVAADFDNDGDPDILVTRMTAPPAIYRNDRAAAATWVGLALSGNGADCAADAVGTRVGWRKDGRTRAASVMLSNGLSAQGDRRLLLATDDGASAVTLDIDWCGSRAHRQRLTVETGRYHAISQPARGS